MVSWISRCPGIETAVLPPQLAKKRQTPLAKVEDTVLSLYSKGMSTCRSHEICFDIEQQIKELYRVELSEGTVSRITSRMVHLVSEWQERPLQPVYLMPNPMTSSVRFETENYLLKLEEKWHSKYPPVVKSWYTNWERLSVFFDFPQEIRRLIYTTCGPQGADLDPLIIESLNSMVRKYTRNKTVYPDDQAVLKSVNLALEQVAKKWAMPIAHWQRILAQFAILYPDRVKLSLWLTGENVHTL